MNHGAWFFVLLGVCAAALGACGDDEALTTGASVTDSLGVRIVHHSVSAEPPQWSVDIDNGLVLGAPPSEIEFFRVTGALQLDDDRIVVADGGNDRVVFSDGAGRFLHATGREGDGPGEFQDVRMIARGLADSLLVWDRRLRRMSVLAPSGRFARSFALETTEDVPFANVSGVYGDGSLMATGSVDLGPPEALATGRHLLASPVYHFSRDGSLLSSTGHFGSGETYLEFSAGGGMRPFPVLFPLQVHRLTAGDYFLVVSSDKYELRFLSPVGQLLQIVRRDPMARPTSPEVQATEISSLLGRARSDAVPNLRTVLEQMDTPALLPEIGAVFADRLGRVWVEEFHPVGARDVAPWHVYGPDGSLWAQIELPHHFQLTDAGADAVVGVLTDELGVETVVRAPLGS